MISNNFMNPKDFIILENDSKVLTHDIEKEQYDLAYKLWFEGKYEKSMKIFQQLYNPSSIYTLRKGICMVAQYLESHNRIRESLDGYLHALGINQAQNPEEDLQYYVPDYLEQRIQCIKQDYQLHDYKIAVYAICKDEKQNLDEWFQSMGEADYICVLDTGSTDGSYELLQQYQRENPSKIFIGQKIYIPWRFDAPRNDSLKLVPSDAEICICTDPDERLVSGGADKIRFAGHDGCERMYYLYAGSHLNNGQPARVFGYDKIHKNSGLGQGKFPIHEALYHPQYKHADLQPNQYVFLDDTNILLHHYPSYKDSRASYLPLIKLRYEENPDDFFSHIYLAHEYYYQKQGQEGINFILQKVLPYYEAHNMEKLYFSNIYLFLGDCYKELQEVEKAEDSYKKGLQYDPLYRDNYINLAELYLSLEHYAEAIHIINECFITSRRYVSGLERDGSGSYKPGELLALAYYNLQILDVARIYIDIAYNMDPNNPELQNYAKKIGLQYE